MAKAFLASPIVILFFITSSAVFYHYASKIDFSQAELIIKETQLINSIFESRISVKNSESYLKFLALNYSSRINDTEKLQKMLNVSLSNKNGFLVLNSSLNTGYPFFLFLDESKRLDFKELNCMNYNSKINALDGKFDWGYDFWNYSSEQIFLRVYISDNSSFINSKYPFYVSEEYILISCS